MRLTCDKSGMARSLEYTILPKTRNQHTATGWPLNYNAAKITCESIHLGYDYLVLEPHTTRIRVRYAETDQMGIVHHSNYYVWMEVARVELCESLGFRYRDMEREYGVGLAVVE